MLVGYMRVSKADGSQATDLQRDALRKAGVDSRHLYEDAASGKRDDRPGLAACLKAEFERELIVERTRAGMAAARARGRHGGRPYKMTAAKLRLAMAAMGQPETKVGEFCRELGVSRQTLYRHVAPNGSLRPDGQKLLGRRKPSAAR